MRSEAEAYCAYLDREGIKHDDIFVLNSGNYDVESRWNLSHSGVSIAVRAIFDKDDDHTVALRAFKFSNAKQNRNKAIIACNELNNTYRWIKFVVDDDDDINIEADVYVDNRTAGPEVSRLMHRIVSIADDAYPVIMKALWS